jgi:hypothetical protein
MSVPPLLSFNHRRLYLWERTAWLTEDESSVTGRLQQGESNSIHMELLAALNLGNKKMKL